MVKSWLFFMFAQPHLDPDHMDWRTTQTAFDDYLDLCVRADELGIDGVFFSEHHFTPFILTPSPNIVIAAVSQRTTTLRLGVMSSVLPLHDVRRLVEELGMLDYLTHGRLEIGIGPGVGEEDFKKVGINLDDVRPLYASGAEIVDKYLTQPRVNHHDDYYHLTDVPIVPRMRQPSPSVWVTAMSPSSTAWAARLGYKVCTSWMGTDDVARLASVYLEAAAEVGRSTGPADFGARRRVFVAPTDAEALDLADAAVDLIHAGTGTSFEMADQKASSMFFNPDDIIVGSPKTVVERLVDQVQTAGLGHVLFLPDFKLFDHVHLVRSVDLIGKEVAPVLRSLTVGVGARVTFSGRAPHRPC